MAWMPTTTPSRVATQASYPHTTVLLMGLPLAVVSEQDTIEHVIGEIATGNGGWICTANVDILRQWRRSAQVRELVSGVDIVVADGMPLVWACALQGTPLPERIAGSTLTVTLTAAAAQAGASVFLLGGNPGSSERAAQKLMELNPDLDVAGTFCPPFGFENRFDGFDLIATSLRDADPDIVFVGLGFPKQERLINELREILPQAWFVGCGVSFSFIAGEFKRAPELVQKFGFEWLYRLAQEPRRLARRYIIEGLPFMFALTRDALVARRATGPRATAALPPASTTRG